MKTRQPLSLESPIGIGLTPTRRVIDSIDLDFHFVKRMLEIRSIVLDLQASTYFANRARDMQQHAVEGATSNSSR